MVGMVAEDTRRTVPTDGQIMWRVMKPVLLVIAAVMAVLLLMGSCAERAMDRQDATLAAIWSGLTPVAQRAMCDAMIGADGENFYGPAAGLASRAGGDIDQYDAQRFLFDTCPTPGQ